MKRSGMATISYNLDGKVEKPEIFGIEKSNWIWKPEIDDKT